MPQRISFSDEQLEAARLSWDNPNVTNDMIAAMLGIHPRTLQRRARQYQWPPRGTRAAPEGEEPVDPAAPPPAPLDFAAVAQALARSVLAAIRRLDAQSRDRSADPEKVARSFATLAKTLGAAQSLQAQRTRAPHEDRSAHDTDGEPPPRSLEELRDELARHLDRIIADEEAAGSDDFLHIARACKDP